MAWLGLCDLPVTWSRAKSAIKPFCAASCAAGASFRCGRRGGL